MSEFLDGRIVLHSGDCRAVLATLAENSVDSCVTDPPYGLQFMGKAWDRIGDTSANYTNLGKPHASQNGYPMNKTRGRPIAETDGPAQQRWHETWACEVYRVLKPGAYLLAFGGSRTFHRMACAIEDAGFEIRDCIMWLYGSGFPKSHDVSKGIDRAVGIPERGAAFKQMLSEAVAASGKSRKQIDVECGFTMRYDTAYEKDRVGWGCTFPGEIRWRV